MAASASAAACGINSFQSQNQNQKPRGRYARTLPFPVTFSARLFVKSSKINTSTNLQKWSLNLQNRFLRRLAANNMVLELLVLIIGHSGSVPWRKI